MLYCVICNKPLDYDTSNPVDGDTVLCACGAVVVVCVADKVEYMTLCTKEMTILKRSNNEVQSHGA